ncbi:MAG: cytochrome c [Nitrospirota bacterium]|nr:cytochrome c [Nitrospirota bacterium]MDE3224096.1 cytochrome c [Nitrospirota bacterium]MDE3243231.1 cytochrome c [Nitrospirota bacterium]
MALRISLLCLTTVLLLTAGRASAAPPVGIPEQGRPIFEARCASCHGPQGRGDGPQAPFLSPRPASLISAGTSVKTDAELLAVITNGKPRTSMPAWNGLLTEQERRDVLAYIRTLVRFHPHSPTPPPNGHH